MLDALSGKVDLIGYTPWGCIDLVSTSTGEMRKRYGIISLFRDLFLLVYKYGKDHIICIMYLIQHFNKPRYSDKYYSTIYCVIQ